MRVVHVLRADHASHVGGDLVQLHATVDALQRNGVDAIARPVDEVTGSVDIVHLYNLQLPTAAVRDVRLARERWPAARLVVSPVIWPPELGLLVHAPDHWARTRASKAWARLLQRWFLCRRLLTDADAVLPSSETERERISRIYRLPVDRWRVVANGVSVERFPVTRRTASPEELTAWGLDPAAGPVIACVARIESYKNQLTLVRALRYLPDALLLFVGPVGEQRYAGAVRAEAARFPRRVAFLGTRTAQEVHHLLAASAVHVLPSFRETPGLATLEAASTGCEVVANHHGSAPEYLGVDAAYADPTSPASIAAGVDEVLARPRQLSLRRRVERYDWQVTVHELIDVYRDVLAGAPDSASR